MTPTKGVFTALARLIHQGLLPRKLSLLASIALVGLLGCQMPKVEANCESGWSQWRAYSTHFIQADGRIIEHSQKGRTTSEGQAYALFHSLIANDQKTFAKVLKWSENNLTDGNLGSSLPAWVWGQNENKGWSILDTNSAADADMWFAYTLLQAGRLWNVAEYSNKGQALLKLIETELVVNLPNLGPMVLPGKQGFDNDGKSWRLNPSYLPIQQLRYFSQVGDKQLWQGVIDSTERLITVASANGAVPDWVVYHRNGSYHPAEDDGPIGSYDAIRVYLWIGMLDDGEPLKRSLLHRLKYSCDSEGSPPERINTRSMQGSGKAPIGFKAALTPYFKSKEATRCLNSALDQVNKHWNDGLLSAKPVYYDQNLAMFSMAWLEGRFAFDAQGRLVTDWTTTCFGTARKTSSSAAG